METEAQRAKLYSVVASHWGDEAAEVMMAVVPPWNYDELARKVDVENCRIELKGEIAALTGKVEAQFGRMIVVNAGMMFGFAGIVLAAAKIA